MPNWTRYASAVAIIAAATGVFMAGQMTSHAESVITRSAKTGKTSTTRPSKPPAHLRRTAATQPAKATTRPAASQAATLTTRPSPSKVVVYYFHRTLRCPTCRRMEELSRQAVESEFKGELDLGMVEWRPLDFQKKGNEKDAKKVKLEGPALVLVKMTNGRQIASRDMDKIWDLVGSPGEFVKYVQDGLRGTLYGQAGGRPGL